LNRKAGRREGWLGSQNPSRLPVFLFILLSFACGGPPASAPPAVNAAEKSLADFAALEARVIERLAASDPRLAARFGVVASKTTLSRIETEGVLAEDAKIALRGASLDPFAFAARARTLASAEKELASWTAPLPESAKGPIARPRLERDLLARIVAEESARVSEESALDDGAGPLLRAVVATWAPGGSAWEWKERDEWIARRLLEIRAAIHASPPRAAPSDLEPALFELEKLLVPMQYPRGVAALTSLHEAIDQDERADLAAMPAALLAARVRAHLGVETPLAQIAASLEAVRARIASDVGALTANATPAAREAMEKKARAWLFEEVRCAKIEGSSVRSAAPPPERVAVCGALKTLERAATPGDDRAAALLALHDMVVVAQWTIAPPPPRARVATLAFRVDEELADRMKQLAAARPLVALGAALAIEAAYGADAAARARAILAIGEAPLDVALAK